MKKVNSNYSVTQSPFVEMAPIHRYLILFLVILVFIFDPLCDLLMVGGYKGIVLHYFLEIFYVALLFFPIIFYRHGEYGWFHPLIFTSCYWLAMTIAPNPLILLKPFQIPDLPIKLNIINTALTDVAHSNIADAKTKLGWVKILGLIFYYLGFFMSPSQFKPLNLKAPKALSAKAIGIILLTSFVFMLFMLKKGGIANHMNTLFRGAGRIENQSGNGILIAIIRMGSISWLLWYAYDHKAIKNPVFIICGVLSMACNFISSGSRSSALLYVIFAALVWSISNKKLPLLRMMMIGIVILAGVETLRFIRLLQFYGDVSLASIQKVLSQKDLMEIIHGSSENISWREEVRGTDLPIMAKVPDKISYLYGATYASPLVFWIPRALWKHKPMPADIYAGEILHGQEGLNTPVSATMEAYWNFGIPGVVLIMLLCGWFHKYLSCLFRANTYPAFIVFYILSLYLMDFTSMGILRFEQYISGLLVVMLLLGIIGLSKNKKTYKNYQLSNALDDLG